MYESTLRNSTSSITTTNNTNEQSSTLNSIDVDNNVEDRYLTIAGRKNADNQERLENIERHDNLNASNSNEKVIEENDKKDMKSTNLSSLTNTLSKSKFKAKLAIWNETNLLNEIPSPKVKMAFSGHRNTRTMVKKLNTLFYKNIFDFF
jgi:hypothetical protein